MNSSDIRQKVFEIVSKIMETPIDQIHENSSSDTIETWDSMTQMSLTLALQEELNVRFVSTEATRLSSVKLIVSALEELLKPR